MFKRTIVFLFVLFTAFSACTRKSNEVDNNRRVSNSRGSRDVYLGDALRLSGQVSIEKLSDDRTIFSYQNFSGNIIILDSDNEFGYFGGNGEIKNGRLNYSIGVPAYLRNLDERYFNDLEVIFGWNYTDFYASNHVRGLILEKLPVDSDEYYGLFNENYTRNVHNDSFSNSTEIVCYVYVESDVTVSARGNSNTRPRTKRNTDGTLSEIGTNTVNTRNFNLVLQAGWNAIYVKQESSGTFSGPYNDAISMNYTVTETISQNNPSLRWVLWEL